MIFSVKSSRQLESMRIEPEAFSASLVEKNGKKCALYFDSLIDQFSGCSAQELTNECFNKFCEDYDIPEDSLIFNQLYDIFNYLRLYREGGVFGLFKGRQAEWAGPKIRITESDVPPWDSSRLKEPMPVYRGMSKAEYESGDFGQSWSVQVETAHRFATEIYSDIDSGVVVKTIVLLESVIYFSPQDCEGEVILKVGSVSKDSVLKILAKVI